MWEGSIYEGGGGEGSRGRCKVKRGGGEGGGSRYTRGGGQQIYRVYNAGTNLDAGKNSSLVDVLVARIDNTHNIRMLLLRGSDSRPQHPFSAPSRITVSGQPLLLSLLQSPLLHSMARTKTGGKTPPGCLSPQPTRSTRAPAWSLCAVADAPRARAEQSGRYGTRTGS